MQAAFIFGCCKPEAGLLLAARPRSRAWLSSITQLWALTKAICSGGIIFRWIRAQGPRVLSSDLSLPLLTPCNPSAQQPLCIPQAQLDTRGGSAIPVRCAKIKFVFLLITAFGFSSCPSQAARAADTSSFRWDVLITHKVDCSALCWDGQGFVSTD